jgi:hypothetical protein
MLKCRAFFAALVRFRRGKMRCDYDREHCRSKQASAAPNKIAALSNGGGFCLLLNRSDQVLCRVVSEYVLVHEMSTGKLFIPLGSAMEMVPVTGVGAA